MATKNEKSSSSVFLDTTSAQYALDKLNAKIDSYDNKLKQTNLTQRELASLQKSRAEAAEKAAAVQLQIEKGLGATYQQQAKYVADLRKQLSLLPRGTKEYADQLEKLKQASNVFLEMKKNINDVADAQNKLGNFFTSFFGNLAAGAVAKASAFISDFFTGTIDEAFQAEEATSNLLNTLQNAGREDLFGELLSQADEFAERFKRLDNDDITNVFSRLIDYGKLTKSQIKETTEVIIDYAAKQKISLEQATEVLVKGLEGQAKGLKTYGVNLQDAGTFAERYALIVDGLGAKVKGAELAFEQTARGGLAVFQQGIRNTQEQLGQFIVKLFEGSKSADELFDKAKEKTEAYENSLTPLLERYDELKAKTTLNKDEQSELRGIIQKIVEIVPDAATEFNNYGRALDINKAKVTAFLAENKKFLAQKEFKAVEELSQKVKLTTDRINILSSQIESGTVATTGVSGSLGGASVQTNTRKATQEELRQSTAELRAAQEELITDADKLVNKYGKELPQSVSVAVNDIRQLFDDASKVNAGSKKVIGAGGKTPEELEAEAEAKKKAEQAAKEAEAKRKREAEKLLADRKKLLEDLKKIEDNFKLVGLNDLDVELAVLDKKYEELRERARGNADDLNRIQIDFQQERLNLVMAFARKEAAEFQKLGKDLTKEQAESIKKNVAALTAQLKIESDKLFEEASGRDNIRNRERIAAAELAALQAHGKKKLDAELAFLNEQKRQELNAKELTESEKAVIEEKYRQLKDQKERDFLSTQLSQVLNYAQQAFNIYQLFNQQKIDAENRELTREQRNLDRQKNNLQRQLSNKLISQQQFAARIGQLEEDLDKKKEDIEKKQFERNKKQQIIQSLINGAQGVTKAIAEYPFPLSLIPIAFAVATTAAQVATISKSKFEDGGFIPDGPSHKEKGIKLVDGKTGQVRGEIEGGEPILSKKTYANNKPLVDALLRSSMYANGSSIAPFYKRPYQGLDIAGITKTIQRVRYFENGGTLPAASSTDASAAQTQPVVIPGMELLPDVIKALIEQLATPQKNYVVYSDIEAKGNKLAQIKEDAVFK